MENETNSIIQEADRRVKFITVVASIAVTTISAAFVAIAIFSGVRLDSEIDRLTRLESNLKSEIRDTLGQMKEKADVVILSDIDKPLGQQTIVATLEPGKDSKYKMSFNVILKNEGRGTTPDEMEAKIYTTGDLDQGARSSDEREFAYESYFWPDKFPFSPAKLPANASVSLRVGIGIREIKKDQESYPMLMKVYFGEENPSEARFRVKIAEKEF